MSLGPITIGCEAHGPFPWKIWVWHNDAWLQFGAFKSEFAARSFVMDQLSNSKTYVGTEAPKESPK